MSAADFFYVSAGVAMWVIVLAVAVAAYYVVQLMKSVQRATEAASDAANAVRNASREITLVKEGVKLGALTFISNFLGKRRGGDESGA